MNLPLGVDYVTLLPAGPHTTSTPPPSPSPSLIVRLCPDPSIREGSITPLVFQPPFASPSTVATALPLASGARVRLKAADMATVPLTALGLAAVSQIVSGTSNPDDEPTEHDVEDAFFSWCDANSGEQDPVVVYTGRVVWLDMLEFGWRAFVIGIGEEAPENSKKGATDNPQRSRTEFSTYCFRALPPQVPAPSMLPNVSLTMHPQPFATKRQIPLFAVEPLLEQIRTVVFARKSLARVSGRGVLVVGGKGTGKSTLVEQLAESVVGQGAGVFSKVLDCGALQGVRLGEVEDAFNSAIAECYSNQPSVLVLDDLDVLTPELVSPSHDQAPWIVVHRALHTVKKLSPAISIVATAVAPSSLAPIVLSQGIFSHVVRLSNPNPEQRLALLRTAVLHRGEVVGCGEWPLQVQSAAIIATEGATFQDMAALASRLTLAHRARVRKNVESTTPTGICIEANDVLDAIASFSPAALRHLTIPAKATDLNAGLSALGGLQDAKSRLLRAIQLPIRFPRIFEVSGARARAGALLYGPPGCGKTRMASAIAGECGVRLITVSGPELLNKYIGASEKAVRDVFERAQQAAPCVLFFDEFESICPRRGADNTGVTDRVVNQFLCLMDGVEALVGVFTLAATSRPDLIDPALLRPGRLDNLVKCPMPAAPERFEILVCVCKAAGICVGPDNSGVHEEILRKTAEKCEGFSGADLQAIVYSAQLEAVNRSLEGMGPNQVDSEQRPQVTNEDFEKALLGARRSVSEKELQKLAEIYETFDGCKISPAKQTDHLHGNKRVTLR
eukprot:c47033_g1_i1.p1 GENE.c47033_g1_i1~~c47033_g1_i1.p1  ORF type:complete len:788 (+),score=144.77 c47033_g1_i1:1-2364(+)